MPNFDLFGEITYTSKELFRLLYVYPNLDLTKFTVNDIEQYLSNNQSLHSSLPEPRRVELTPFSSIAEFDHANQVNWYMPDEYKELDIAKWLLDQCKTDAQLQRVGEELLMFQDRELFDLLRFLKYMVDTMRQNNILWGVGRGSSVSSYVLYLIGIHKIDSMYYDLDIHEFLR